MLLWWKINTEKNYLQVKVKETLALTQNSKLAFPLYILSNHKKDAFLIVYPHVSLCRGALLIAGGFDFLHDEPLQGAGYFLDAGHPVHVGLPPAAGCSSARILRTRCTQLT